MPDTLTKEIYAQNEYLLMNRNYSIDLLRVIAMFMIVFLHCSYHGGLEFISEELSPCNIFLHFLKSMTWVSVNIYVLISGYFLCNQQFRLQRLLKIVIETFFYCYSISALLWILGYNPMGYSQSRLLVFPISYSLNWFVTTYLGLCLLSPIINKYINRINKKEHLLTIVVLFITTCLWRDLIPGSFAMNIEDGKRITWFVFLYLVSAYIRNYVSVEKIAPPRKWVLYFIGISLISTLIWTVLFYICKRLGLGESASLFICNNYYQYTSSFSFIGSVFLFVAFLGMKISSRMMVGLIRNVAPLTLGIYLLHDNVLIRDIVWAPIQNMSTLSTTTLCYAILYSLIVFVACTLVDFLRSILFKPFYKSNFWIKVSCKLEKKVYTILTEVPVYIGHRLSSKS